MFSSSDEAEEGTVAAMAVVTDEPNIHMQHDEIRFSPLLCFLEGRPPLELLRGFVLLVFLFLVCREQNLN